VIIMGAALWCAVMMLPMFHARAMVMTATELTPAFVAITLHRRRAFAVVFRSTRAAFHPTVSTTS